MTNKTFFETLFSESIYRDVKCNFFKPAEKILLEDRFFSVKVLKRIENLYNFPEKVFRRSLPMDT